MAFEIPQQLGLDLGQDRGTGDGVRRGVALDDGRVRADVLLEAGDLLAVDEDVVVVSATEVDVVVVGAGSVVVGEVTVVEVDVVSGWVVGGEEVGLGPALSPLPRTPSHQAAPTARPAA